MGSPSTHQEREFWCCGMQWQERRGAEAEFKCRLVKLGAERTFHWEGSPGLSHTVLTKWEIPEGTLLAEIMGWDFTAVSHMGKTSCSFCLRNASL